MCSVMEIAAKVVLYPFVLAIMAVVFASMWKIFNKAGRSGWVLLIPIYNLVTLFRIAGKPGWWALLVPVPLVNFFVLLSASVGLARTFGRGTRFGLGILFLGPLFLPLLAFSNLHYRRPE
jgi:hypothetical protein